tara:strand:- start:108 stop:326 length:219 start_codon:yes stop_codon:yes gene_type:complete
MYNYSWNYNDDGEPVEGIDRYYPCRKITYDVAFDEGCTWHSVIHEFARFLDSTGYVGVSDRIDALLDGTREE